MRIGIDCRILSTGIGRYVRELINHLAKRDQETQYVLFLNTPDFETYTPPAKNFTTVLTNIPHYSFAEQTRFLRILNSQNLDLMHFTHFNSPIFYNKPSISTIHDLTLHFYPDKFYTQKHRSLKKWAQIAAYRTTIKATAKKAKHIIAVSKNTKKDISQQLNILPNKISVIHEGVAAEFKPATDTTHNKKTLEDLNITMPYILYTGAWRVHKNLINLIQAFNIVSKQIPTIKLVLTGKIDPDYPEIPAIVKELHLEQKIITPGMVTDQQLIHLYQSAELFVFPSHYEGFGLPPLEAMACGTPVVVSNSSCIPEICGTAALYSNPNNYTEMAGTMLKVLLNKELHQQLVQKAEKNLKRFSWEKMAKETIEIYKRFDKITY
jgi:glycosyltransferase involved in cell wall biosynthesis